MGPGLPAPMAPGGAGEGGGIEPRGAEVVAPFPLDLAAALGPALDHADQGEAGEGGLARVAAVREQPGRVAADGVAADLDPAVPAVGRLVPVERARRRVGEEGSPLPGGGRAVGLERPAPGPAPPARGQGPSPPRRRMVAAIPVRHPIVTSAPTSASRPRSGGMAAVSSDLPGTASCPSTSRWRAA